MLRDLVIVETPAKGVASLGGALAVERRERPRLLIVHHGDTRLVALEPVLGDLGYRATVVGSAEEAIAAIVRGPQPDVLLTPHDAGSPRRGIAFARECLARWPALRALYVSFIPRQLPETLPGRERVLAAPFNAEEIAAALTMLWPGDAAAPR